MKIKTEKGLVVDVYKHSSRSVYVNSKDCTTEYEVSKCQIVNK